MTLAYPWDLASCRIFETFATANKWIAVTKFGINHVVHMVDNFLILNKSFEAAESDLATFQAMCSQIGILLVADKTFDPSTNLPFLGIELCTVSLTAYLPLGK